MQVICVRRSIRGIAIGVLQAYTRPPRLASRRWSTVLVVIQSYSKDKQTHEVGLIETLIEDFQNVQ
jgi:hypothetical protein